MRTVFVRWSGGDPGTFTVDVDDDANVSDLKNAIERVTSVRHSRCKLINLRLRGKPATDDAALSSIEKLPKVVMMMGQKEASYEAARLLRDTNWVCSGLRCSIASCHQRQHVTIS